ncbi:hypothetical protein PV328_008971, partial [Microctonus aethiopoides]
LKAELYYVREGVVNAYAMTFVVLVPANMADLEFSWESLAGIPARVLNCEDGPEYWCISQKTAKQCNKANACFEVSMQKLAKHDKVIVVLATTTQNSKYYGIPNDPGRLYGFTDSSPTSWAKESGGEKENDGDRMG